MCRRNSICSAFAGRRTGVAAAWLFGAAVASTALAQIAPLSVVVLSGDPAPGAGAGVTFATVPFNFAVGVPFMNNTGRVAFLSGLAGTGVTAANDFGIWVGQPGALVLVAREGDPAPDLPGLTYGTLLAEGPLFSGSDAVSFRATLAGPGVTAGNDDALFTRVGGSWCSPHARAISRPALPAIRTSPSRAPQ